MTWKSNMPNRIRIDDRNISFLKDFVSVNVDILAIMIQKTIYNVYRSRQRMTKVENNESTVIEVYLKRIERKRTLSDMSSVGTFANQVNIIF